MLTLLALTYYPRMATYSSAFDRSFPILKYCVTSLETTANLIRSLLTRTGYALSYFPTFTSQSPFDIVTRCIAGRAKTLSHD